MTDRLLTAEQVAERWSTTPARVHALARGGDCRGCGEMGRRFNLNVRIGQTTRGAGRTFLCETCWQKLTDGSPRRGGSPEK